MQFDVIRKIFWGTRKRSVGRRHQLKLSIRCGQERREPTSVTRKVALEAEKENDALGCTGRAKFLLPKGPLRSVLGSLRGARHLPSKAQTILAPHGCRNIRWKPAPFAAHEKRAQNPKELVLFNPSILRSDVVTKKKKHDHAQDPSIKRGQKRDHALFHHLPIVALDLFRQGFLDYDIIPIFGP